MPKSGYTPLHLASTHGDHSPDVLRSHARFEEREFVDGLRSGSARAFKDVMRAHRPRIYALALRFTRDHHEAEDLVQETFLRAFRAAPRFRGDCSVGTWLYAITRNLARHRYWYWHRRKRSLWVSLDEPHSAITQSELSDALAVEGTTGFTEPEAKDFAEHLEGGMSRLSEQDRRILILRTARHTSYVDIARDLGVAVGAFRCCWIAVLNSTIAAARALTASAPRRT